MFVITVSCSISSPALSIILNGKVFVAFVIRYPRALVYSHFPFLIVDLIVKVSVVFWQSSLAFVSKASKWLEKR